MRAIVADIGVADDADDEVLDELPVVPGSVGRVVVGDASGLVDNEYYVALLAARRSLETDLDIMKIHVYRLIH